MTSGFEVKHGEAKELSSPKITTGSKSIPNFDTADDFSDHLFAKSKQSFIAGDATHKAISKEWKILGNSLPDTIYVQVNEKRIDLMRAAIIGPQGTPYHDGLFFFDIFFPTLYPKIPPTVLYRSFGLRLNPNLYKSGTVCLSLLNTWIGEPKERWIPEKSTVLQVLVSIQALVLNEKPYFNEPVISIYTETASRKYNENVFVLSCKSMAFLIHNPPISFKDLVAKHFYDRAQVILTACQAYINGSQVVGYYQKDQPFLEDKVIVPESFKISMEKPYENLVAAFGKINTNPTDGEFLDLEDKVIVPESFKISMEKPYENLVAAFGKINTNPTDGEFLDNKMAVEADNGDKVNEELKGLQAEKGKINDNPTDGEFVDKSNSKMAVEAENGHKVKEKMKGLQAEKHRPFLLKEQTALIAFALMQIIGLLLYFFIMQTSM